MKYFFALLLTTMQKVIAIKFLSVTWTNTYKDKRYATDLEVQNGLDKAHSELESKISEYLKNGWVMKGEVSYPQFVCNGSSHSVKQHLVQTMVKYEEPKVEDLLKL